MSRVLRFLLVGPLALDPVDKALASLLIPLLFHPESLPRRLMNGEPIILRPAPTGVALAFPSATQATLRQVSTGKQRVCGKNPCSPLKAKHPVICHTPGRSAHDPPFWGQPQTVGYSWTAPSHCQALLLLLQCEGHMRSRPLEAPGLSGQSWCRGKDRAVAPRVNRTPTRAQWTEHQGKELAPRGSW